MKKKYDRKSPKVFNTSEPEAAYSQFLSNYDIVLSARTGYFFRDLIALSQNIQKKLEDLARIMGVSLRTLQRYAMDKRLSVAQSERLLEVSRLYGHGYQVFDSPGDFHEWMDMANVALGGVSPFSLLDTHAGISMVDDLIGRIEHGVYS